MILCCGSKPDCGARVIRKIPERGFQKECIYTEYLNFATLWFRTCMQLAALRKFRNLFRCTSAEVVGQPSVSSVPTRNISFCFCPPL
jgi:hypothetical protein